MTMDLKGAGGECGWTVFDWGKLLRLAQRYGWQPAGTIEPGGEPDDRWEGGYLSNDDQLVTEDDARALADALEAAVVDIPDEDVIADHRLPGGGIEVAPNPPEIDDRDWFCGPESKDYLRDFIRYCRAGAFRIG